MNDCVPTATTSTGGFPRSPILSWAREVLDGVVFSDGFLFRHGARGNSYLSVQLSGKDHIDWLCTIRSALVLLGVEVPDKHPYVFPVTKKGKFYEYCFLRSHVSPFLTKMRDLWYPEGVKEVLKDFKFTPVSLAHAFMGDGSSSIGYEGRVFTNITTTLHTQKYNMLSMEHIEYALRNAGIVHIGRARLRSRKPRSGAGIVLTILQPSVDRFMEMVEPHMEASYKYKVKYRRRDG